VSWIARWDRGAVICRVPNLNRGRRVAGLAGTAFVVVFVFAGARVEDCLLVSAGVVVCFCPSDLCRFRSTTGLPLVVTFVESLRLRGPEALGESVGIGSGCGMWFWDVVLMHVHMFLQCNFIFLQIMPQVLYSRKVCRLRCCSIFASTEYPLSKY
jgi:hypothetical protein